MTPPVNPCGDPTEGPHDPREDVRRPVGPSRVNPEWIGADGTWPMNRPDGPCRTWPLESGCGCLAPDAGAWDANKTHAIEVATEILWRKTAGKYGLCQETVRPCRAPQPEPAPRGGVAWPDPHGTAPTPDAWYDPDGRHGRPLDVSCGCAGRVCDCADAHELRLPGPVYWETPDYVHPPVPDPDPPLPPSPQVARYRLTVWIDGQQQKWWMCWLFGSSVLVRVDGKPWPTTQRLDRPLTDVYDTDGNLFVSAKGSWGIQYWRGIPVPPGGRRAVSILACELWKACVDDPSCRLPRGIQSISREGIDYTLVDQQSDMLANLPDVNGWVQAVNPRGLYERPTVWSPDFPKVRSEWTSGGRPMNPQRRGRY